ncbi:hypothetical protein OH76DRAFT_1423876 [Lentinus brumalis]|uniref:F-box domain-containing protein n=1 Tax=Lentinus brumalis TaxID=2498619 RepID=A0A371CIP6_9APHY|nr:hypothetical protein OH76DRAFT_1423876 [Polyporus brumalis]
MPLVRHCVNFVDKLSEDAPRGDPIMRNRRVWRRGAWIQRTVETWVQDRDLLRQEEERKVSRPTKDCAIALLAGPAALGQQVFTVHVSTSSPDLKGKKGDPGDVDPDIEDEDNTQRNEWELGSSHLWRPRFFLDVLPVHLLMRLPNLQRYCIADYRDAILFHSIALVNLKAYVLVRELKLERVQFHTGAELARFLIALPQLRRLECHGVRSSAAMTAGPALFRDKCPKLSEVAVRCSAKTR